MNIAIVGFSLEGKATFDYFSRFSHKITICDADPDLYVPDGVETQLGPSYLDDLDHFDLIIRSAGIPPRVLLEKNPDIADKISTHVNEFFKACPTRNIIGVTGTKGKGTTSTLITKMLEAAGKDVYLGGNIGVPPFSFFDKLTADSWVVLELSSFQLIDLRYSPHIAVCLMVVPEHLNWHADMDEYVTAKSQLFAHQSADDVAIYYAGNSTSEKIAGHTNGTMLPFFSESSAWLNSNVICIGDNEIITVDEIKLRGGHNIQNVCAAMAAFWQVSHDIAAIRSIITTFTGLSHRLEYVRTVNGITYVDDSFGTTPETAIVAIQAYSESKVVILGGSDKGASYDDLARVVVDASVKHVVLIGDQADRIRAALDAAGYLYYSDGGLAMSDIVQRATDKAEPGDIVLLSTGCASFGLFKDYKDRAAQFIAAVEALPEAV